MRQKDMNMMDNVPSNSSLFRVKAKNPDLDCQHVDVGHVGGDG